MKDISNCLRTLNLLCWGTALTLANMNAVAQVKPPPLPPGSAQVKVEAGESPAETKRNVRAHSHKGWARKDPTRDDRRDPKPGKGKNG